MRVKKEQIRNIQKSGEIMILTPKQAKEIGEALIDASETVSEGQNDHKVIVVKDSAISIQSDLLIDDWETVATVSTR